MFSVFEETDLILNILVCVDLNHIVNIVSILTSLNVDQASPMVLVCVCLPLCAWR